ncbi:hypothetical protein UJ101_02621 [Flavobacteriaceae bacterium UJ101]|nr:hypothetical protein UJ101_02621 [Flavobacteriaceae bacterium UJ101]
MLTLAVIGLFTSCNNDDDNNITDNILPTPSNLTISDTSFYPEDITITNNIAYISGFGDGTIRSFDLTQTNPTAQLFASAESGYAQSWGLKSDGTVLLNLLNNADFTGNPPGPSKLIEYNIASGEKTGEWDLPETTIGHTVSIVNGKYYISDFGNPRIIEVDPSTGAINDSWFTSSEWDPSIDGNLGGTIYDPSTSAFYIYLGFKLWYLPINNGQPGTLQEVNISGLSTEQINMDGISWGKDQNTLYYASNDAGDPNNVGTVYKLEFSNSTTATGSVIATGLDDTSGVWYLNNNGSEYLYVCESQFGALFGFNSLETPFNIEVINL